MQARIEFNKIKNRKNCSVGKVYAYLWGRGNVWKITRFSLFSKTNFNEYTLREEMTKNK